MLSIQGTVQEHGRSIKTIIETVLHPQRLINKKEFGSRLAPQDEQKVLEAVQKSNPIANTDVDEERQFILKSISAHLISLLDDSTSLKEFEGKNVPSISIPEYVDRLVRYVEAWAGEKPSPTSTGICCALMGIEYIDRLNIGVSYRSIHRLYLCAVLVAVKYVEDFSISNRFWAKVGGIDLEDMNRMEFSFCSLLGWKLSVSREDFEGQQSRFGQISF